MHAKAGLEKLSIKMVLQVFQAIHGKFSCLEDIISKNAAV